MHSYEEFTNELETLLRKYFGEEWGYWYDDRLTIVSQNLEKMYEYYCNESEVKEMGSCRGHQETDAEYEMRVAKLKAVGKPCNCGSEVN